MKKLFPIVFVFIMASLGFISRGYGQERRSDPASTFLKSESAIVRLGVWDKFGEPKRYMATFVVVAPNGKQSRAQKGVAANEGWVYADFPNEFTGEAPDYSTYATYKWKCLVGGKEIATGQFKWGNSRASAEATGNIADDTEQMTPRRETLKRRVPVPNNIPAEVKPNAASQSQEWSSFWNAFRAAVRTRDRAALRPMMASSFEYGSGERLDSERVFSELDYGGGENWRVLERTLNIGVQPYKLPNSRRPARVAKNPLPCGKRPCDYTAWAIFELGADERWRWVSFIFPGD